MYFIVLQCLVILTAISHLLTRAPPSKTARTSTEPEVRIFSAFQTNYLIVYLLAVTADWLQGPYIYALYSHYGFQKADIGRLYIAGFASSAVFGTIVASVADKYGRRSNALLYCVLYIASCLIKHSTSFNLLLLGRVLGGIAYSILFSAFEAWMVYEHTHRGFDPSLLGSTFARAQFWNGVAATMAGQTAGWFAELYGKVVPFDVSIAVLIVLAVIISMTWTENYGDSEQSVRGGFSRAWASLMSDEKILLIGVSQGAFEGALFIFTYVWTPALQTALGQEGEIPHGTIFSSFMAATMVGSNLFTLSLRYVRVEALMRNIFVLGAVLFAIVTISHKVEIIFSCFLLFEVLCGVYFPGMATLRSPNIPEESRSALLTFFRVPINLIVVFVLYEDMSLSKVFAVCTGLMVIATISQQRLMRLARSSPPDQDVANDEDDMLKMEKAVES